LLFPTPVSLLLWFFSHLKIFSFVRVPHPTVTVIVSIPPLSLSAASTTSQCAESGHSNHERVRDWYWCEYTLSCETCDPRPSRA